MKKQYKLKRNDGTLGEYTYNKKCHAVWAVKFITSFCERFNKKAKKLGVLHLSPPRKYKIVSKIIE